MLKRQYGFSLLEIIFAMAISSILMLSVAALFPEWVKQYFNAYRQFRLEQVMRQALFKIEKDLRRAGFIKEAVMTDAVTFYSQSGNATACLIIRYDLNHNGKIETGDDNQSELFGYRLLNGALEQHRGASDCAGNGWEKIVDANEIKLTYFDVEAVTARNNARYFIIRLNGQWQQNAANEKQFISLVRAENI